MPRRTTSTYMRVELVDDSLQLSLRDLCQTCGVNAEAVIELVEYGVLLPRGRSPSDWAFAGDDLMRIKKALRLRRDLAVNLPGVALSLELMDEIEHLRRRLNRIPHTDGNNTVR